ncbi:hypothetical protein C7972_106170 [Arenibacter sp. ARW7G5Y1]|nr:hypothetical protein C7972_106170 [Arenibacter sp. ARW7G5Y1]
MSKYMFTIFDLSLYSLSESGTIKMKTTWIHYF